MIAAFNFMILVGLIAPWKDLLLFKGLLSLTTSLELVSAKVNCESKLFLFMFTILGWFSKYLSVSEPKFHVNIITGSGIMTIFFYKGLTRNPEMGNTHVWVLPNIWRLGWVMDTKLGTNVSNRMLLNAVKFQGGGVKLPPPPTQIRVKVDVSWSRSLLLNV